MRFAAMHNTDNARSANLAPKIAAFSMPKICKIDAANAKKFGCKETAAHVETQHTMDESKNAIV